MSKEFSGMDMVVPRDAASFPSAPSRRHLVHAGTTRRLTGRAVGPIARRPRASSRRSPRSGGRRKPIRGTSMQPPGKYGAPVVSRKSGPVVRLLSCQFTHAPNKHLLLLLLHQRRRPREDAARRRLESDRPRRLRRTNFRVRGQRVRPRDHISIKTTQLPQQPGQGGDGHPPLSHRVPFS